jgi:hypothetical protein
MKALYLSMLLAFSFTASANQTEPACDKQKDGETITFNSNPPMAKPVVVVPTTPAVE